MKPLRQGDSGPEVVYLQERLIAHGFLPDKPKPDGKFGPKTLRAVEQFQASHGGLDVDGVVGPLTWDALTIAGRITSPLADEVGFLFVEAEKALGASAVEREARLRVISCATLNIGCKEQPDGSNTGPQLWHLLHGDDGRGYWETIGLAGKGYPEPPWCALAAMSWIRIGLELANWTDTPFGTWFGGVSQIETWATKHGVWTPSGRLVYAEAGSVFCMAREGSQSDAVEDAPRAGHCGLVVADDGMHVWTVEGNVGNAVAYRHRLKSTLRGFVEWWKVGWNKTGARAQGLTPDDPRWSDNEAGEGRTP
jgi:hypothetical protein